MGRSNCPVRATGPRRIQPWCPGVLRALSPELSPEENPFTVGLSASHLLAGLSVPEGDLQVFNVHLQPQVTLLREKRFMKGLTD